tara:strand:- start:176 stop:301 length:126 start_codon:yes stop_codon:yes gene_type:complete
MNVLAEKEGWIYVATMTNTVGVVKIGYSNNITILFVFEQCL